jgi:hypothetical protein
MPKLPVPYQPTYDFRRFAQLGQQVDGERLASQLEELARFCNETELFLLGTFDASGGLPDGSITSSMLEPGLFDQVDKTLVDLVDKAKTDIQLLLDRAIAVDIHSTEAVNKIAEDAKNALKIASKAESFANQARIFAERSQISSLDAASSKIDARNALNATLAAEAEARLSEEQAYLWAEYLAGPVVKADPRDPQYNQAVDDGYYSAKFWALEARRASPGGLAWYLGAFTSAPTGSNSNGPLVPGHMYYNPTTKLLYVWDGSKWTPAERTTLGIASLYTYFPQTNTDRLSGADFYGLTPVFKARDTYEVHVNGVQLWPGDISSGGDYDIDFSVTPAELVFAQTLESGDIVTLLELMKASDLQQPIGVDVVRLADLQPVFDGVSTAFELYELGGATINCTNSAELQLYVDGVIQMDGKGYSFVPPYTVYFDEPPMSTAVFLGTWIKGSGAAAGGVATPGGGVVVNPGTAAQIILGTDTTIKSFTPKVIHDAIIALAGAAGSVVTGLLASVKPVIGATVKVPVPSLLVKLHDGSTVTMTNVAPPTTGGGTGGGGTGGGGTGGGIAAGTTIKDRDGTIVTLT